MSTKPKRYYTGDCLTTTKIVDADIEVFRADDPAVIERFKKAELYDTGMDALRAEMEAKYRETIETLKAQCVNYGKKAEALDKLEEMVKKGSGLELLYPLSEQFGVWDGSEPTFAPSLREAIEAVTEKPE